MRKLVLLSTLLFVFACSSSSDDGPGGACGDLNLKIANGESCVFEDSPVVLIVTLDVSGAVSVCTGTMVTLDDVLTAAHCFPSTVVEAAVFTDRQQFDIVGGAIHPFFDPFAPAGASAYDIAMLTLDRSTGIAPVPLIVSRPVAEGDRFTIFGFGQDEEGRSVLEREQGDALRAAFMRVAVLTQFTIAGLFDETGSNICPGDSGGPATQVLDGVTGVVGVASFDVAGCGPESAGAFVNIQDPDAFGFVTSFAPDVTLR